MPALSMVGVMVSRNMAFKNGLVFGEVARGVFAAVGRFEGRHPLLGFGVFDGGEAFEIAAGDGGELDGRIVGADFRDGGGKMHDGIVFRGH